jgi:hypothetical protein
MGGTCGMYGIENKYTRAVLERKPEGKSSTGRPRRTWENTNKMFIKKQNRRAWTRINFAQDRDT